MVRNGERIVKWKQMQKYNPTAQIMYAYASARILMAMPGPDTHPAASRELGGGGCIDQTNVTPNCQNFGLSCGILWEDTTAVLVF